MTIIVIIKLFYEANNSFGGFYETQVQIDFDYPRDRHGGDCDPFDFHPQPIKPVADSGNASIRGGIGQGKRA
jgi:hypothetical protein